MNQSACPRCGFPVDEGILFCPSCKAPLIHNSTLVSVDAQSDTQVEDAYTPQKSGHITLSGDSADNVSRQNCVQVTRKSYWFIPVSIVVILALILSVTGLWWFNQSAQSLFSSYIDAIEQEDYAKANQMSIPSEQSTLTVKPHTTMSKVSLTMQGKDTAVISYTLNNHSYKRIVKAHRKGLTSWTISQGLAQSTRITSMSSQVKIRDKTLTLKKTERQESFIPVPGITRGARIYKRTATMRLYPGTYEINIPGTSWYEVQKTTIIPGTSVHLVHPHVKTQTIQQLIDTVNTTVNECMASTAVHADGCAFANPNTDELSPQPNTLTRHLSSEVSLYAVDFESHTFTTGYITTDCEYSFEKDGAQVKRTVHVKNYAQGTWDKGKVTLK